MPQSSSQLATVLRSIQFRSMDMWCCVTSVLLWCLWLQQASAHVVTPGKCPQMQVKRNFDIHKYMGTWYGYASFGTESTQGKGRCVTARYAYNSSLRHIDVYNWQIPSPGYRSSINGSAVVIDPETRQGELQVTFIISGNVTKTFPLQILGTDYERWAVVYFCKNLLNHHETSGWILTRDQHLDKMADRKSVLRKVQRVLKTAGLEASKYTKTVQHSCTTSTS